MRVTIEVGEVKCVVEEQGFNFNDLMAIVERACLGVGFGPETVKEFFHEN